MYYINSFSKEIKIHAMLASSDLSTYKYAMSQGDKLEYISIARQCVTQLLV